MIKIDFEITQHGYTFRDAIHLPDEHEFTDADIEAMKQQRFDNWYTVITTPVDVIEPPVDVASDVLPEEPQV